MSDPRGGLEEYGQRPPYKHKRGELEAWLEKQRKPDASVSKVPATTSEPRFIKYEAAKRALTEAAAVDEVKAIHVQSAAMQAYAKQAKDTEMEEKATEIRMRAERRLGQLMEAQKQTVGFNTGTAGKGRPNLGGIRDIPPKSAGRSTGPISGALSENPPENAKPTLGEAGIDKNLAQAAREAAKPSDQEFEKKVEEKKAEVRAPQRASNKPQKPRAILEGELNYARMRIKDLERDLKSANVSATMKHTGLSQGDAALLEQARTVKSALGDNAWGEIVRDAKEALTRKANGEDYDD
jgi:hypothetical protein